MTAAERSGRSGARLNKLFIALVVAATSIVILAYWPGVSGVFVLDDIENFRPIEQFLAGEISASGVIFTNESGPLGRPLSMASFLATAAWFGLDPMAFKAVNLIIHLLCGALVGRFVFEVLRRVGIAHDSAKWIALLLMSFWLLAPVNVSTVLYPVQRMAQLSALFMLLGLLTYMSSRARMLAGQVRSGLLTILVGVPCLTVIAALCKENGALLPLLCAVVEASLYRRDRRPAALLAFLLLTVVVPFLVAAISLFASDYWSRAYEARSFTLVERLLTQPRVLLDYVRVILLPDGPSMGLIHDDYPLSRALFGPWTTAAALLAWGAIIASAWRLRNRSPMVLLGTGLFLGGHAMESTVFPLEIYFEHRNYLPSIGVFIAACGCVLALRDRFSVSPLVRRACSLGLVAALMLFALATHARSMVWADWDLMLTQELRNSPDSVRINAMAGARAIELGNLQGALARFDRVLAIDPSRGAAVAMWRMFAYCRIEKRAPASDFDAWRRTPMGTLDVLTLQALMLLSREIEANPCSGAPPLDVATFLRSWLEPLSTDPVRAGARSWMAHYFAARLAAAGGDWALAAKLADVSIAMGNGNTDAELLRFQIATSAHDRAAAAASLERLKRDTPDWNRRVLEALPRLDSYVRAMPAVNPHLN